MRLSEHFSLEEMIASQEAVRHCIDNSPEADIQLALEHTAERLEVVRALLNAPMIVTSGYRCERLNALIGGARESAHCDGFAVDFICPQVGDPFTLCTKIMGSGIKFDQLIQEGTWVHISFAPAMRQEVLTARFTPNGAVYSAGLKP